ncbi:MAG: hypothetical protein A2038_09420 [Deltaproteobacteria bacterium GWA2_57_13]|nr:MAG: hypothetical protein A2038_09420 [Deltaproteobacteria bacterium GWA2_57_13]
MERKAGVLKLLLKEKMTYQEESQAVICRCKLNPVVKKNFAVFPVLDWIATLTAHIPSKGEQLVRYYGYYSNVSLIPLPAPSVRERYGETGPVCFL